MIRAFRVVKLRWAEAAFDGEGARRNGGRWNSIGIPVVYVAQTLSQAILEVLVHAEDDEFIKENFCYFSLSFDAQFVELVTSGGLATGWNASMANNITRSLGDLWFREARTPVLQVPSAIVPGEFNFLLNPSHPDFSKVLIGPSNPLSLDARLG